MRKMAIATAIMKLFTAQSGYRNRDNEIVHCTKWLSQPRWRNCSLRKGSHNRDNEIVHCAKGLSQPRQENCSLRKEVLAVAKNQLK